MFSLFLISIAVLAYATCLWYPLYRFVAHKLGYFRTDSGRPIPLTGLQYIIATGDGFIVGFLYSLFHAVTEFLVEGYGNTT